MPPNTAGDGSATGQDVRSAWMVLMVLGTALAIVGLTDVALLWFPARWASVDWEFGTVSAAIDGMPLATIGLGLAGTGAIARGRRSSLTVLAVVIGLMLLALVGLTLIFALDVPVVLRAVDPQLRQTVRKAMVKTGSMALVYVALYLTLGVWVVRRFRVSRKGAGT